MVLFIVTPTNFRGGGVRLQPVTPGCDLGRSPTVLWEGVKFQQTKQGSAL